MNYWIHSVTNLVFSLTDANGKFSPLKTIKDPLLITWVGQISTLELAKHILTCTKLTGGQKRHFSQPNAFPPDKFSPDATHDFLAVYQKINDKEHIMEIFRFQIASNDAIATTLTQTLGTAMANCSLSSSDYLLNNHHQVFWQTIAQIKLQELAVTSPVILTEKSRKIS